MRLMFGSDCPQGTWGCGKLCKAFVKSSVLNPYRGISMSVQPGQNVTVAVAAVTAAPLFL